MTEAGLTVAVIGGSDVLTGAVARHVQSSPGIAPCVVVDGRAPRLELPPCEAVVYLAGTIGARGLPAPEEQVASALRSIAAARPRQIVLVSSALVFPPRHTHPGMVDESRPPMRGVNAVSDAWLAFESQALTLLGASPALAVTVLRPAATPTTDGRDYMSRLLRSRFAATVVGHDPTVQLLAVDDLADAIRAALVTGRAGVFHVAPSGNVPLHRALALAGTWRVPLPKWLHRLVRALVPGLAPWDDVSRLVYSSTVAADRIQPELGFEPKQSSAAVAATLGGRAPETVSATAYDPYGLDTRYVAWLHRTIIGFLHRIWWRVETAGLEHVPRKGPAVLVGVHRGFMPFDGAMVLYDIVTRVGRHPRFLIHPSLTGETFLADFIRRQGGLLACRRNADFVLRSGELLGYFPEGIDGAFSYYRDAYRLRRDFGRDEFVKAALRNRAPIVPFVTVGSAEIFPVLAKIDWGWWKRYSDWPCFPIAPPFPLLPVPLPSKWHTRFLEPIPVHLEHGPEAAEDEALVAAIGDRVRALMQSALDDLRTKRKHVFFGNVWDAPPAAARSSEA